MQLQQVKAKFYQLHWEDQVFERSVRSSLIISQKSGYFLNSLHEFSMLWYRFKLDRSEGYRMIELNKGKKKCLIGSLIEKMMQGKGNKMCCKLSYFQEKSINSILLMKVSRGIQNFTIIVLQFEFFSAVLKFLNVC
jgi:hypothetical protein